MTLQLAAKGRGHGAVGAARGGAAGAVARGRGLRAHAAGGGACSRRCATVEGGQDYPLIPECGVRLPEVYRAHGPGEGLSQAMCYWRSGVTTCRSQDLLASAAWPGWR